MMFLMFCGAECDVPVPGIPVPRNFSLFLMVLEKFGTEQSPGTGLEKIWYQKKSRNRIEKIWYRKKSRNWSRKILVPKKSRNRSRKNLVTKSLGIGSKKNLVPKSPSIPLEFCCFGLGLVPFPGFLPFLWYWNRSQKNLVPKKVPESVSIFFGTEKSIGTGLEKNLVPKKVPEPVSDFFGTEKSLGTGLGKFWYRKKVSESVSFRFWVSSHTASAVVVVVYIACKNSSLTACA